MKEKDLRQIQIKSIVFWLSLVSFFLAFNYFILKSLKETLLLTAPEAGAEAIPFVKTWFLFPFSLFFLFVFTWMVSRISFRFAVSAIITFFLFSYAVFAFFCFPIRESLHLHSIADQLQVVLPGGWRGFTAVIRYWSYSLFYVTAECWCTLIYSVVFWGYANAVMKLGEAKKYYPFLTLAGTLAALVAGPLTIFLTGNTFRVYVPEPFDSWEIAFYALTASVLLSGTIALVLFQLFCPRIAPAVCDGPKIPIWQSFLKVFRSKYLVTLAIICLSLNLVMNLTDVVWKNEVLKYYSNPSDFTSYLSHVTLLTGIISTIFTLFVCRPSLKRYGWTRTALIAPYLVLVTGSIFFFSIYYQKVSLSPKPFAFVAFLGSVHVCLSCGAKYTLFEPAKEMAFIPLSSEEKLHGKAVIDGLGARLGRTSSSIIYQFLLIFFPTITACTPIIAAIIVVVMIVCMRGIGNLGGQLESDPKLARIS